MVAEKGQHASEGCEQRIETPLAKKPSATKAGATEALPPRLNPERLRLHLRSEGLAAALLDAWTSGAQADSAERLRKAADDFFGKAKRCNDSPAPPKD
jgi:hypothetical protein